MKNRELQTLISRWFDETIEPEESRELQTALRESAGMRRVYRRYARIDAELRRLSRLNRFPDKEQLQEIAADNNASDNVELEGRGESPGHDLREQGLRIAPRIIALFATCAGLLLALGIWQGVGQRATSVSADESLILTKIEPVSDACRWNVEGLRGLQAKSYRFRPGDVIRVTSGKLNLLYSHGTTVLLHSPAAYQLISDKKALLLGGCLTASVPEAGIGFSVITPRATVVDLGTDFGVEVNNDSTTDVVVFKGKVDVVYHDQRIDSQRLHIGEGVHLDATGTASRIVSIANSTYSIQPLPEPSRPVVITEVRDNIERDSSLHYYEIVHGGMGEDVLTYVDRRHEYNGITQEGIPSYLVGGDYVKTFNSDKVNRDIRLNVILAAPARLYILFDDRLTTPVWLRDGFRDTGDDIGMERGDSFIDGERHYGKAVLNVGPGNGVDDIYSVWVRDVPHPGVVALGSLSLSEAEVELKALGFSMYGIVAIPLEETQ